MKPIVTIWIVVLIILLLITIANKNPMTQAKATVVETDCVNVPNSHPCTVTVRYDINGSSYTQKMGVNPSDNTLLGKKLNIGYNPRFPLQIKEHRNHINLFMIPTVIWFFLGIGILYFMYDPIRIRKISTI